MGNVLGSRIRSSYYAARKMIEQMEIREKNWKIREDGAKPFLPNESRLTSFRAPSVFAGMDSTLLF